MRKVASVRDATQFPITVEVPTPWRRLPTYDIEEVLGNEATELVVTGSGRWVDFDLPLEVLPLVGRVDLDSVESILSFVRKYGPLGPYRTSTYGEDDVLWSRGRLLWADLPDPEGDIRHAGDIGAEGFAERIVDFRERASIALAGAALEHELNYQDRFSPIRLNKAWPKLMPWEPPAAVRSARLFLSRLVDFGLSHLVINASTNL